MGLMHHELAVDKFPSRSGARRSAIVPAEKGIRISLRLSSQRFFITRSGVRSWLGNEWRKGSKSLRWRTSFNHETGPGIVFLSFGSAQETVVDELGRRLAKKLSRQHDLHQP